MRTVIRTAALAVAAALVLLLVAGVAPANAKLWEVQAPDADVDPQHDLSEFEKRILVNINKARANQGRHKLRYFQSCVDRKSERWSRHLVDIKQLVHRDQMQVIKDCHYTWAGETLARGTGLTPAATVRAWLDSPSHRAVILKRRATRAGVAVRPASDGMFYAVLNFGDHT